MNQNEDNSEEYLSLSITNRGFGVIKFKDAYDIECSLQKSSRFADEGGEAIWLGVNDAQAQILASQAAQYGVNPGPGVGWVPYPVPEEVLMHTRMHLDQEQVKKTVTHTSAFC